MMMNDSKRTPTVFEHRMARKHATAQGPQPKSGDVVLRRNGEVAGRVVLHLASDPESAETYGGVVHFVRVHPTGYTDDGAHDGLVRYAGFGEWWLVPEYIIAPSMTFTAEGQAYALRKTGEKDAGAIASVGTLDEAARLCGQIMHAAPNEALARMAHRAREIIDARGAEMRTSAATLTAGAVVTWPELAEMLRAQGYTVTEPTSGTVRGT